MFNWYGAYPSIKRPRQKVEHSPSASAEIKETLLGAFVPSERVRVLKMQITFICCNPLSSYILSETNLTNFEHCSFY